MSGTSTGLSARDQQRREQREQERGERGALTDIRSRRFRRDARRGRAPCAARRCRMMIASASRSKSGLMRSVSSAPYWAPITPPTSSSPASTMSTDAGGQRMDHGRRRADREDHHQAGADHDARRHAEQIDHRRDEDEAAADAEEDGEDAGDEAERERRDRRDVQARAVEAPAQRKRGDPAIVPRRRRLRRGFGADIAERDQRILQHQSADRAEDQDVEEADHDIDLAARLEHAEQRRADDRAGEAADDHHPGHFHVDAAAAHVDHRARHAGAGDLGRGRGDGDRRRDSVEDQQRRGQEAAADAEHARQHARRGSRARR